MSKWTPTGDFKRLRRGSRDLGKSLGKQAKKADKRVSKTMRKVTRW